MISWRGRRGGGGGSVCFLWVAAREKLCNNLYCCVYIVTDRGKPISVSSFRDILVDWKIERKKASNQERKHASTLKVNVRQEMVFLQYGK